MADETGYQVDLDEEKILFDDQWVGRKELAERIRQMIESQDYRISAAGLALEYLETNISGSRSLKVKLAGSDAEAVAGHADRAGIPVAKFLRQAIQAYLASQPPLEAVPDPSPEAGESEGQEAKGEGPPKMPEGLVPLGPAQPAGDGPAEGASAGAGESSAQAEVEGEGGQPPGPVLTTITTEPAEPGDASGAVELTSKKPTESSKVVVDPTLAPDEKADPNTVGDSWFKKR